jgi:NuA3 HAT complex component NTO1
MSSRRRRVRRALRSRRPSGMVENGIIVSDKPRAECSYKEIYPDLDVTKPLGLYWGSNSGGTGRNVDSATKGKAIIKIHGGVSAVDGRTDGRTDDRTMVNGDMNRRRFRVIPPIQPPQYVERTLKEVGYCELEEFHMPDAYIRTFAALNEPVLDDHELAEVANERHGSIIRVEYDMDEQDDQFLNDMNTRRLTLDGSHGISKEMFEITMTLLESEWFKLERLMPARKKLTVPDELADSDDQKCIICDDSECDNSNAIVFCDGCDIAVHQECYGVPFIPEGQWLCRQCSISRHSRASCMFCPNKSGAFKQTDTLHWAHVLCALWIPETAIANQVYMEPIVGIENIPKGRWKLNCIICRQKVGACIQCANKNCFQAFHPTCARKARLCMRMIGGIPGALHDPGNMLAFCEKHTPEDYNLDVSAHVRAAQLHYREFSGGISRTAHTITQTKIVKKRSKSSKPWLTEQGTPVIPDMTVRKITNIMSRFAIWHKREYLNEISRYWALKRQLKGGAALNKRLQVALDTEQKETLTDDQVKDRLGQYHQMLKKLGILRKEASNVRERERIKLELTHVDQQTMDLVYFPEHRLITTIWTELISQDHHQSNVLSRISSGKITIDVVEQNVINRQYLTLDEFADAVRRLFNGYLELYKDCGPERDAVFQLAQNTERTICEARVKIDSLPRDETGLPDFKAFHPKGLSVEDEEWIGARLARELELSDLDSDDPVPPRKKPRRGNRPK